MRATVEICGHPFHAVVEGDTVTFATFGEPPEEPLVDDDHPVASALRAYAAGDVVALERIAVRQPGSEFRQRVWAELRTVAPGAPISYTELAGRAGRAGRPAAVRAAASGCATNRIPLIVPCHRVVRADGGLGGYAFGLDLKRLLLEHEARR